MTFGLESIIQPARDRGHEGQRANEQNISNIYKNKDTMQITKFSTKEETWGRNQGLEAEFINYIIKDFLTILPVCMLDAIEGFIQLDYRVGSTIWIQQFAFQMSHVEDFMERAVEECHRDVKYGYIKIISGCKAYS